MKIHDALYGKIKSLEQDKLETAKKGEKGAEKAAPEGDQVSLSQQARDLAKAAEEAKKSEGVRTERIEELKRRIESGGYSPDTREIARKMLRDDLDLWL